MHCWLESSVDLGQATDEWTDDCTFDTTVLHFDVIMTERCPSLIFPHRMSVAVLFIWHILSMPPLLRLKCCIATEKNSFKYFGLKGFKKIKNSLQLLFISPEFISLRSCSTVPSNKWNTKLGFVFAWKNWETVCLEYCVPSCQFSYSAIQLLSLSK